MGSTYGVSGITVAVRIGFDEYLVGPVPPRLFAAIRRTPMPAEWEWLFSNGTVQR